MKRNMYPALAAATTALCAAGCAATPIAVSTDSLSAFRGQTLTIVTYDPHANFTQFTAGNAIFGAVGGVAAVISSNNLVKQYDLVNPSLRVAEKLTPVLSEKLKPSMVNPIANASDGGTSTAALAALAGKKGLVFDVDGGTQAIYFPFDWTRYQVRYFGTARLVDASTGKVVAQAPCQIESDDAKSASTYDELYADNAVLMKSKLQADADRCVAQVTRILFSN